jgi:uncharacterized SAM-binding protein YcdF (DUF218 family)
VQSRVTEPKQPSKCEQRPLVFASLCAFLFLMSSVLAGFVGFALSLERSETTLVVQAEGVVALTGGSDRVVEAAELLARGQARRLLITGVNRSTHGDYLARLLPMSRDLFACCVDLGYRALDTAGNAAETRDWAKAHGVTGSLIVVTSNYHMPRALVELAAALPRVKLYPYPVVSEQFHVEDWPQDLRVMRLIAGEYFKYLFALARTSLRASLLERSPSPQHGVSRTNFNNRNKSGPFQRLAACRT